MVTRTHFHHSFLLVANADAQDTNQLWQILLSQLGQKVEEKLLFTIYYNTSILKKDAAHEPEYSHVDGRRFCKTSYLNSLAHFPPVTVPVHCRLWNVVEWKVGSVKKVEC